MVTEPRMKRILLGRKHRGFGTGFMNSFGGKAEPNETFIDCAVRELEEETGIQVQVHDLRKTATLHFTFDDSPTEMVVYVYRLDVDCSNDKEDTTVHTHFKLDPSIIRGCEEITPEWIENWYQIPLDEMFADDSLWLTTVLAASPEPLYIEGYFHFEPGGQETNSIRHYWMDVRKKERSLEERLFHELHARKVHSPSIKEFKEVYAFTNATRAFLGSEFDIVLDVAGGQGALAALLLLTTTAVEAVVIDPADVGKGSVQRAWGKFLHNKILRYRHECLREGLPKELNNALTKTDKSRILVVACHACQHLSDEVLEISVHHGVAVAVMPCCQNDLTHGLSWKQTSKNLGIPFAKVMDVLLAGKCMSWGVPYDVRIKAIQDSITPQNRIILCRPDANFSSQDAVNRAHERLKRAYRRAHDMQKIERRIQTWIKVDLVSLVVGVALGITTSFLFIRRR